MNVLNGTWVSPIMRNLWLVIILMILTVIVESVLVYWFGKRKKYAELDSLLTIVLLGNFFTGLLGVIVAMVINL